MTTGQSELRDLYFTRDDIKRRPTSIYKKPCGRCPSMHGDDPESAEIRTWPRDLQLGLLFVCAWRQKKLCTGLCLKGGFTEPEIVAFRDEILSSLKEIRGGK